MYLGGPVSEPEAFKRTDRRKIYSNTGGISLWVIYKGMHVCPYTSS